MKPIQTFIIGSNAFFTEYSDYVSKDIDKLCIMDSFPKFKTNVLNMKLDGEDIFFFRNMSKEDFIKDALECNVPMRVGKFLVPEFIEYIGLTIDDIMKLEPLINSLDEKHEYEKIIYNAYIENKKFQLTDQQRKKAYETYKKRR